MCKFPVKIKNPNKSGYGKKAYGQEFGNLITVNPALVPQDDYIMVPCGKCEECRKTYINSIIQRAIVESLTSYCFFITLTYNNEHLPYIDLNGERFFYADYNHIKDLFKRFRANYVLGNREFRYLCVSEYGERFHRPHFHLLLFVSKLDGDNPNTPYSLESTIFKNLGKYFSINTGTRKNPHYEPLYTYKVRGNKTNYYVKYVDNDQFNTIVNNDFVVKHHNVKAIKYLVNYTFKPSSYERHVEAVVSQYQEDKELYKKLRSLLKCKLNYSKGFGCGFTTVNGERFYLNKISVRCSSNVHVYSEIINTLPDSYEEFTLCYPEFAEEVRQWRNRDFYQYFSNWRRCLNAMDSEEYMLHCVYIYYFKDEFTDRYKRYKKELEPRISNIFSAIHKDYMYHFRTVKTVKPEDSITYRYLRNMVDESIKRKLLTISFIQENSYIPMCKYYRQRVSTFDDQYKLYQALGVKNYEEWLSLFNKTINNRKSVEAKGNLHKYYNDDLIEDIDKLLDRSEYLHKDLFTK